jgi:cytochrome c-type biogenesis protein CcmH/NrfG
VLEAAIRGNAESTTPTLVLADLCIRSGRFDDAIARLAPLLQNDPSYVPARLLTEQAYFAKSDLSSAIGQFETVTRLNPQLFEGHYLLARALLARGDREDAKREYRRAAELAPDAKQVRIELTVASREKPDPQLLSPQGGTTSARSGISKRSIGRNPNQTAVDLQLADLHGRVGRVPEGVARAKDVFKREPRSAPAHIGLGTLYLRSGDLQSAIDTLGAATRLAPNSPEAHFALAAPTSRRATRPTPSSGTSAPSL